MSEKSKLELDIDSYKIRIFDLTEHVREIEYDLNGHRKLITDICGLLEIGGGPVYPEAILGAIQSLLPVDTDVANDKIAEALDSQNI